MEHKHDEHKTDTAKNPSVNKHENPIKPAANDHSKMDHKAMQHDSNPTMGMEGHDHHAMMIADYKKRFYFVLFLSMINSMENQKPTQEKMI